MTARHRLSRSAPCGSLDNSHVSRRCPECQSVYMKRWRDRQSKDDPVGSPESQRRFWSRVDASGDCWLWMGYRSVRGYGQATLNGRTVPAYRRAYELLAGPVPDGMELDHLCRNRACVNPDHLEPVTTAENWQRGYSRTRLNAARTHCVRGHLLSGANLRLEVGKDNTTRRLCRTCRTLSSRLRKQRLRELRKVAA